MADCPKCKKAVFKNYPKGFVNEFNSVVIIDDVETEVENWHCPGCGHWDRKPVTRATENTSDKPKKKKVSEQ